MKIRHEKHIIDTYDSLQDLNVNRYQLYSLYAMIDAGIGSDIAAFDQRISNVRKLIESNPKAANTELTNMQQNLRFVVSNTSPKLSSFAVLIKSIDGEKISDEDLSESGINEIIERINKTRLPIGRIIDFLNTVKKKFEKEFEAFFPKISDNSRTKELYTKLKSKTLLTLRQIQGKGDFADRILNIEQYFIDNIKPKNYSGKTGLEIQMIKGFEETCILLSQNNASGNPKKMKTIAFYQALELIKSQNKKR